MTKNEYNAKIASAVLQYAKDTKYLNPYQNVWYSQSYQILQSLKEMQSVEITEDPIESIQNGDKK